MKSLVASCIILILLTLITVFGSVYVSKSIDEITAVIEAADDDKNIEKETDVSNSVKKHFEDHKILYALLINDKDMDEIEVAIEDLGSAVESRSFEEIKKAKNRLSAKLEQMRRLSAFNIDSVF